MKFNTFAVIGLVLCLGEVAYGSNSIEDDNNDASSSSSSSTENRRKLNNPYYYQTPYPTHKPPTGYPTYLATPRPTPKPTPLPTPMPTPKPTSYYNKPTPYHPPPTMRKPETPLPTPYPTQYPTSKPVPPPTFKPTTPKPTFKPTPAAPTASPSASPSAAPTDLPSDHPSAVPSRSPSASPSSSPTDFPSDVPSTAPSQSEEPSDEPTLSEEPSEEPTLSSEPSEEPTLSNMPSESFEPSGQPSVSSAPSASPTSSPRPTVSPEPTDVPSASPSATPSASPSASPTDQPSSSPSDQPSPAPTPETCGAPGALPTIADTVCASPTLMMLCDALKLTDLLPVLGESEPQFVLFAPSNAAFKQYFANPNTHNATSKTEVSQLLLYHVTGLLAAPSCTQPSTPMLSNTSFFNPSTTTTMCDANGVPIGQSGTGNGLPATEQPLFDFPAPPGGLFCCNGRVQPIDQVLVPQEFVEGCEGENAFTIADSVCNEGLNPDLTTLCAALTDTGLLEALNEQSVLTLFAPTNEAFKEFDSSRIIDNFNLTELLLYHVTAGLVDPENNPSDCNKNVTMLASTFDPDATFTQCSDLGNSQIGSGNLNLENIPGITDTIRPPLAVCNGVINKVNSVIVPQEIVAVPETLKPEEASTDASKQQAPVNTKKGLP
eukprot:CAMPEP_0113489754 /NCGR_PEP_ID=MMETSP0014_2-20120614/26691_1 /TAXON_ID=2857 /ORGANISM="Nitzschia sp." /LENGTH=658 /DNA_ID=CAMNT_0000383499 /DNA_START=208 /DNA_END=2184 /DNA_ORIENTATION=- /assembly_acc=CAM_ASM_000159